MTLKLGMQHQVLEYYQVCSTIVIYDLKLATEDWSDKTCWRQNFVPWGLSASCPPGAIYMY